MKAFIQDIVKQAGKETLSLFGKSGVQYTKARGIHDVVTEADLRAEAIITEAIKKHCPNHGIISEEAGEYQKNNEYVWIIDPLDGTLNFSKHIPLFASMVALMQNDTVTLAAIYDPMHDELGFAEVGKGAYINGKRVHASKIQNPHESIGIIQGFLFTDDLMPLYQKVFQKQDTLFHKFHSIGSIGIEALYLANGRVDWKITRFGSLWDYAPTALLLKEAGYKVTALNGADWKPGNEGLLVANEFLHAELSNCLKNI